MLPPVPPKLLPTPSLCLFPCSHVGLKNLGNSCYVNSVLQVLWALPELRARYADRAAELFRTAPPEAAADFAAQFAKVGCVCISSVEVCCRAVPQRAARGCSRLCGPTPRSAFCAIHIFVDAGVCVCVCVINYWWVGVGGRGAAPEAAVEYGCSSTDGCAAAATAHL